MPVSRKSKNKKSSGGSKSQKKNIYKKHKTMKKNIFLQKGGVTVTNIQNFNDMYPLGDRQFTFVIIFELGKNFIGYDSDDSGDNDNKKQIFSGLLSDFNINSMKFRSKNYEIRQIAPQIRDEPNPKLSFY